MIQRIVKRTVALPVERVVDYDALRKPLCVVWPAEFYIQIVGGCNVIRRQILEERRGCKSFCIRIKKINVFVRGDGLYVGYATVRCPVQTIITIR